MSRRKTSSGFTLVELVLATSLSAFALMGIFALMTSMVQAEADGMRNGTVTAWSIANINAMGTDIPQGSYMMSPPLGGSSDTLEICTNWSGSALPGPTGGALNNNVGNLIYYYCYDTSTTGNDPPPFQNVILRKVTINNGVGSATCPAVPGPAACTSANYLSTVINGGIVATGVYRADYLTPGPAPGVQKIFTSDPSDPNNKTVDLNFIIGLPTNAGAVTNAGSAVVGGVYQAHSSVPQTVTFKTKIILED